MSIKSVLCKVLVNFGFMKRRKQNTGSQLILRIICMSKPILSNFFINAYAKDDALFIQISIV